MATQSNSILSEPAAPLALPRMHRFSVDQYHQMIDAGVFDDGDRVQLIDGWIVEMTPIGPPHSYVVTKLHNILLRQTPASHFITVQQPITLANSEPEPDLMVVRGSIDAFRQRHPVASEVPLVVEVADSSLAFDRTAKLAVYAAAGIPQYWIVNLADRHVEVFSEPSQKPEAPTYRRQWMASQTDTLEVSLDDATIKVAVKDILP